MIPLVAALCAAEHVIVVIGVVLVVTCLLLSCAMFYTDWKIDQEWEERFRDKTPEEEYAILDDLENGRDS